MIIRRATLDDLPALSAIAATSAMSSFDGAYLSRDTVTVLAAQDGGRVVAFAIISCVVDESELYAIAVHPSARRRGIARSLLEVALLSARARGATIMHLEVRASNRPARTFYSVEGFEESGLRPRYYGDGEDAILMRRIIR